jgi:phosphatidylserine decarboxylase
MKIDRAGYPFIATAALPAALFAAFRRPGLAIPLAALGGLLAFFFRDPDREIPRWPGAVLAPADGRVLVAGEATAGIAPPGDWQQISIFLSPLDVHVNRIPISGRLTRVEYRPGRFVPAYEAEAATSNERNELWIEHDGERIVCRQIAGVLVRRVVCRLQEGMEVQAGDRFGVMKFGSRIDLFLPRRAALLARVGDRVRAGETLVATLSRS